MVIEPAIQCRPRLSQFPECKAISATCQQRGSYNLELEDILNSDIIVFLWRDIREGYNFDNYDYHEAPNLEGARNYTQLYMCHRVLSNTVRQAIDDS